MGVIFCFLSGLLMSFEPITDNDYFWHVVIGHWIDSNKAIPTNELFSWYGNYSWTSHEWLTEFIMYKLGPIGCIAIMLIIFLILYFIMFKMLKLKFKKLLDFKLLFLLLMTVFFKVTGPRPYIISLLTFAYLIYVLFSYIDNEKPIFKKLIWTIPFLQIIWVNLHGGSSSLPYIFLIGVLISDLIIRILPFKFEKLDKKILDKKQRKDLLIILILTLIATCINPFTYKMLIYPFTNMLDNNMIGLILEWQSPSFHGLLGMYIFIMIAFPLFNLILCKDKIKFHELVFQLLLLFMCLKSQRFVGMYGIYSTWTVGKYFFITEDMYEIIKKPFKKFEKIISIFFSGILVVGLIFIGYIQFKQFKIIDNHGYYSDEAILKLIELKPKKMYNDFGAGGYLLYKLDEYDSLDDIKIFSYGLGDVFSNNILIDSTKLQKLNGDPQIILDKYDFDVLINVKSSPLHYYLEKDENYEKIYEDDMCFIFKKNTN